MAVQHQESKLKRLPVSVAGLILLACVAVLITGLILLAAGEEQKSVSAGGNSMKLNKLTPEEERVIVHKGTEQPFSGEYCRTSDEGEYLCKRCNSVLYKSSDKFATECGWPGFDDAIPGAVKEQPDADGLRTEILCANCDAHLGHVFLGEGFTDKNVRHCVNSISLDFKPTVKQSETATAYFAGGCFWGVEYHLQKLDGVISVVSGYMGGATENPSYQEVCGGASGHAETVEVIFDPSNTSFEQLARLFFEIHDPTQVDRQGPDIGNQYRSAIFYVDDEQKTIAEKLIGMLSNSGYAIVTEIEQAGHFWPAETHHQDYYNRNGKKPYCHIYQKRF